MEIKVISSGSEGNALALLYRGGAVLIDAGIPAKKIERGLMANGIAPHEIKAIFMTHSHGDHSQGIGFSTKYKIPVYSTAAELAELPSKIDKRPLFAGIECIRELSLTVLPFSVPHDSPDPTGFAIVDETGRKCSVCLDAGTVTEDMLAAMRGSDIYVIEANHDEDMLLLSHYHTSLIDRIASYRGHLSNKQTAEALAKLLTGKGEIVHIVHTSSKTNSKVLAKGAIELHIAIQRRFFNYEHYVMEVH